MEGELSLADIKKMKGSEYSLPDIGNMIDHDSFWGKKEFKDKAKYVGDTLSMIERLAMKKNFNPELNKALALMPFLRKGIESGKLRFEAEIPGVNSDRAYFGFRYSF